MRRWVCAGMLMLYAAAAAADPDVAIDGLLATPGLGAPSITSGAADARFVPVVARALPSGSGPVWLRLSARAQAAPAAAPVIVVRRPRGAEIELYARDSALPLPLAAELAAFRGMHDAVFLLPAEAAAAPTLYARVDARGVDVPLPRVGRTTLGEALARGAEHGRMIAIAVGALLAMALAALLIWFVLADRVFVLYAGLFALQALYIVYLSGQGFDWPLLALARPLGSHAWNVPAALSGAFACLFVREIADLRRFSPRVYAVFGGLATAFVVLAVANAARHYGWGGIVSGAGNLLFVGTAVFTLVVSFVAWRRGIRAAGWFLVAWGLLEAFTIATAARLLMADHDDAEQLLYYWLPLSMVAAAVLIALGVADRLRDQRQALTVAERHAQTDALTGVLNRRSLIERLEAACLRARARNLPIAVLFIDLDHFKAINDSYGHAAGDACLRAVVGPIQAELRQSDVIGRYGGEEFVVILSSADTAAAHPIAERIRERVAASTVDGFGAPIHLTCSIGVAGSDALGVWGEQLIARADTAVYAAKGAGRNRVQVAAALAA